MRIAVVTVTLFLYQALGGTFRCGFGGIGGQDTVTLKVPHPPDALLQAKNLRIQWQSVGQFQKAEQLRQNIEQSLNKEFGFADPSPDATIRLAILSFEPVTETQYPQNETRPIKVGEKPIYNKEGKQTGTQDIIENRLVRVDYWEGNGSIRLNVSVVDKTGVPIDAFAPEARYHNKREIAVNGESTLTAPQRSFFTRQPPVGGISLPTPASLEIMLMDQIANQVRRRYTATFDPVTVILACDGELRQGNKLAQAGQWKEAQDTWTGVTLKKHSADKTFNVAVATEALAYAEYGRTQSIEDMLPLFTKAMDLYSQALAADLQEKYMREQRDRLTIAKTNIENVRKQYELQKVEAQKAEEAARKILEAEAQEKATLQAALKDTGPDTPEEAKFRPLARARVAAMGREISKEQTQDLVGFGQRTYGLTEIRSRRVVVQEIDRQMHLEQSLKDYEDTLKAFIADGRLTKDERALLKDVQQQRRLDDTDVRSVEAKYTFRDETKAPSTRASAPSKPSAAQPGAPRRSPAASPAKPGVGTGNTHTAAHPATVSPKPGIGGKDVTMDATQKADAPKK